jgi:hypothetical protein
MVWSGIWLWYSSMMTMDPDERRTGGVGRGVVCVMSALDVG